ncbi:MAG: tetratricopeptide repeat protein [Chloroflexi bacterium]|nr:tetratricopeptide repeat protein [Chloroflexota bacterium]
MDASASFGSDFTLTGSLNEHERQILGFFAEHRSNQEIADALFLSLNTVKWYARQIYGKLGVSNRREAVERANQLGLLGASEPISGAVPHNLPAHLTPFVGRKRELSQLCQLLLDAGCRLLSITGPGGMGKTRLALAVADLLVQESPATFKDGVFLVPLADLEDGNSVATAVANTVGFRFYQADIAPGQQLGQFLRRKQMLLVLDNFEHLIDETALHFLTDLLASAPDVALLVTSRLRLNLQGEQVFPLYGLDAPQSVTQGEIESITVDSVKLFVDAARRASPTFVLNPTNLASVAAICRLVEGMPLAIELAAAWTAVLNPAEILKEIRNCLDFLASDAANVPVRQRSLPVVLDASWQLLSEVEREGMRKISVFRGGFTNDAAREVADASPKTLLGLVGKSWLQRDAAGRYRVHALLHQYAAAKLAEDAAKETEVRSRHSLYYCRWLTKLEEDLRRRDQQGGLRTIAVELENMRSACFWAANQRLYIELDRAINALGLYYNWQYGFAVGDLVFEQLARELAGVKDESGQHALAQILTWRCTFRQWLGDAEESKRLADAALRVMNSPVLAQHDLHTLRADIALEHGYIDFRNNAAEAKQHFRHSYELYEQSDDRIGMAYALVGLGRSCRTLYQFKEAEALIRQGVRLHESEGNRFGHCDALMAQGAVVFRQQRFDEAERLFKQCLSMIFSPAQTTVGQVLYRLALVYHASGRFTQAAAMIDDCLSFRRTRCRQELVAFTDVYGGMIHRDLGEYEKGRRLGEEALALTESSKVQYVFGMAKSLLGSINLLEDAVPLAYECLREGVATQLAKRMVLDSLGCQAWLGITARTLGQREEAWRHIRTELKRALHARRYLATLTSLAGLVLLLTDDGEVERAVELHALLLEHPYTARAHWFSQIITPVVMVAAAGLSPEQRSAAAERGRAQDVWEVAAKLAGFKQPFP